MPPIRVMFYTTTGIAFVAADNQGRVHAPAGARQLPLDAPCVVITDGTAQSLAAGQHQLGNDRRWHRTRP